MKLGIKKDFCVWLVSPNDGTVKKVRFTSRRAIIAMSVLAIITISVLYMASDYTRVQMLRAKHFFTLQSVTTERDELLEDKESLESQVEGLEGENQRVLTYERSVRDRIGELSSILKSAESFGVIDKNQLEKLELDSGNPDDGMGGGNIDCGVGSKDRCSPSAVGQWDDESRRAMFSMKRYREKSANLIDVLDEHIEAVNRVPFMVPVLGHISSGFGSRRSPFTGRRELHKGIDFSLPTGSEILVTADGVVKDIKRNRGYGLMIDIQHSDRVITRYGHLSKVLVTRGQKVCQGQLIGLVGSTGRSTGPHLHYEVQVDGRARNPMKLFELGKVLHNIL
jgi:hypothetical protein